MQGLFNAVRENDALWSAKEHQLPATADPLLQIRTKRTRPRNLILTERKAPDAVELCAPWGSFQNVQFCIYQRQHPTSLLPSTERGLSSDANRLIFKGVAGRPTTPPQDTAWDLCSGSFREGSKTGEILLCSEPVNQAPLRPSWRSLSTWPLSPRRLRREGEGRRGTPADRCFSSHKSPTPRSPSHLWVTEEWSRAAGCALKGACFNGGRKRMKRRSAVCFFPARIEENIESLLRSHTQRAVRTLCTQCL